MDFLTPEIKMSRTGTIEISPAYSLSRPKDLMIRGKRFYAIWDEERNLWSTSEFRAFELIDKEMSKFRDRYLEEHPYFDQKMIRVNYLRNSSNGMAVRWQQYTQKLLPDSYTELDNKIIFANTEYSRDDYVSSVLSYPLEESSIDNYNELMSTLYDPDERKKIEWAIGSIVNGDSKWIQKFMVFVGDAGTGKSTVLKIIRMLFEDYCVRIDAKALGAGKDFALEPLTKKTALVAIQDDADLSKIEDNTKLNSLVSHEYMVVNEKFKAMYETQFKCFIFLGSNKEVMITDARSGLLRRLIDVEPSGRKLSAKKYYDIMEKIKFELGGIAWHCKQVYEADKFAYDTYFPVRMIRATNHMYNFVEEHASVISDGTRLLDAWDMYQRYCTQSKVAYPLSKQKFKNELMQYFKKFTPDGQINEKHVYNYYSGFRWEKIGKFKDVDTGKIEKYDGGLVLDYTMSLFDAVAAGYPAQYASDDEVPLKKWSDVTTTLKDIDTTKLHYVKLPLNHIVIDFDLRDEKGEKSKVLNLEASSKWPETYAEFSKGGNGIHLHYIYTGDPEKLAPLYSDGIEIKVFKGNSSLRRRLSCCNNKPIATISSGLPLKGEKMVNFDAVKDEKHLRALIAKNLRKGILPATKPSVDLIYKTLEEAYESGIPYDVTDMRADVMAFANNSTNNSDYCVKLVAKMKFQSEESAKNIENYVDETMKFYDVEVFPNLFVIVWKEPGKPCVKMINPDPSEVKELLRHKLVGFNCRRYDNHIMYARSMGYSEEELFKLSQKIVNGDRNAFFREAYNLSYTDIYDFASAGNKMSLKKWEIKLGIHHLELGLPWDQPVPEELWEKVADYCINDVVSTEATFNALQEDWLARQILADLAGLTVNDTTNTLTTRIIFGEDRNPQGEFNYRDLSKPVKSIPEDQLMFLKRIMPEMVEEPHGEEESILPYFPGYVFDKGVSTYKGKVASEGGYVESEPDMYGDVALLDVMSMHPHSTLAEVLFGVRYTERFYELVYGRVDIKHEEWDEINDILEGKLTKWVDKVKSGELTSKGLANALKTAINSVYGLTDAGFENPFRDPRNIDNIVAKRGALFMIDLSEAVKAKGFKVAHIKTDSIKIPDATPEIIDFVFHFGKRYGYTFEHEATYDKMCLVNDAVYIAKYASVEKCQKLYGYVPGDNKKHPGEWTATGAQFAQPYVFKTLFSHEPIEFVDMCETKTVKTAMYLDMNENLGEGEHSYKFVGKAGQFTPILPGKGGGELVSERGEKYNAVTGTKGFRWLESEIVRSLGKEADIDKSYYYQLVDEAIKDISEFGDFNWFAGDADYNGHLPFEESESKKMAEVGQSLAAGMNDEDEWKLPFD